MSWLDGVVIDDTESFNDKLQDWEDFYNFNRPHGGLNGQTPPTNDFDKDQGLCVDGLRQSHS